MCVCVCVCVCVCWGFSSLDKCNHNAMEMNPYLLLPLILQNSSSSELLLLLLLLLLRDPPLLQNHQKSIFFSFFSLSRNFFFSFFWNLLQKSSFFWASCFIRSSVRFWGIMGCMQPQCNGMKPELLPLRNSSSSSDISFRSPSSFSEPQLGFEEWLDKSLQLALLQTICVWWRWGHLD